MPPHSLIARTITCLIEKSKTHFYGRAAAEALLSDSLTGIFTAAQRPSPSFSASWIRRWLAARATPNVSLSPPPQPRKKCRREPKARRGREQTRDRHACCFPFTGRAVNHNRPLAFSQEL